MGLAMEANMQDELSYRGYTIYHDGQDYVAEASPDDIFLQLRSLSLQRVTDAIDEMGAAIEQIGPDQPRSNVVPDWLAPWFRGETSFINLDAVSGMTKA